jgi:hypothetical protein
MIVHQAATPGLGHFFDCGMETGVGRERFAARKAKRFL